MELAETADNRAPLPIARLPAIGTYDLKAIVGLFRRRLRTLLAVVAVVFLAVVLATFLLKPVYTAGAGIKIDPTQRGVLDTNSAAQGEAPDAALIDTEITVMKSHEVSEGVVEKLDLIHDPEFNPKRFGGAASAADPTTAQRLELARVISRLAKHVSIYRDGSSYMVNVEARSHSPDKAARIANAIAEEYIIVSQRQKIAAALAQQNALAGRAADMREQAEQANAAVAGYRASTGIVSGGTTDGTVLDQQASAIATELSQARADAAAAEAKYASARRNVAQGTIEAIPDVLTSTVIADLRRQRTTIVQQQDLISKRYGPRHPEYVRVSDQLKDVDSQIQAESNRIVGGLENAAQVARSRAADLQGQLASLEQHQASNARAQVQAQSLQQRADSLAALANSTTQVVQRAAEQAQVGETQGRITTLATTPIKPSFPNKPLFAALGLVLGALLGAATVFVLEAFDGALRTVSDVEELGVPYLASVPMMSRRALRAGNGASPVWDYVKEKPLSAFAESLRNVRTGLRLRHRMSGVIMITSALPNEGKTTTAVSLARVMAMSSDRVLLIDGDLRRNSTRSLLTVTPAKGLLDVLTENTPVGEVIVKDSVGGLDILPLANSTFTATDLFGNGRMQALLAELRLAYDYIIIDAPPVFAVADARVLAALADAVLLAVRWNKTHRLAVHSALARLQNGGANVAGAILTMVDISARAQFGAGDLDYYSKEYKAYYQA